MPKEVRTRAIGSIRRRACWLTSLAFNLASQNASTADAALHLKRGGGPLASCRASSSSLPTPRPVDDAPLPVVRRRRPFVFSNNGGLLVTSKATPASNACRVRGGWRRADAETGATSLRERKDNEVSLSSSSSSSSSSVVVRSSGLWWSRPSQWSPRQRRKALSLAVLAVQNSALTLTMRYSRTRRTPPGSAKYFASEAVVMSELFKAIVSLCFAALARDDDAFSSDAGDDDHHQRRRGREDDCDEARGGRGGRGKKAARSFARRVAAAARDAYAERGSYVLIVPAALYAVQNNLQYVAASNLEPAVFQLLYQMKLLTTAFFSVVLLQRRLSTGQWAAVALLALGLGLASVGSSPRALAGRAQRPAVNFAAGFAAVFAACCSSGFSSVYFERVVKTTKRAVVVVEKASRQNRDGPSSNAVTPRKQPPPPEVSVWARNAQLATFSSTIAALGALLKDGDAIAKRGPLVGFSPLVWTVVALQAGGGLCTAAVIAYADNLLKGFATGISMLVSVLASAVWFDFRITPPFLVGAAAVLGAIGLYSIQ